MFRLPVHLSRGAPLKSSLETHTEKWNSRHSKFSNRTKCPMVRPQWYSTLEKPTSGYQPQVGSDRVAFIKPNCPYVGQCSCPTNRDQSHHDLRSITANDCAILGIQQPRPHRPSFKQNTHHASHLQLRMQLAGKRPHTECVFQYNSHK